MNALEQEQRDNLVRTKNREQLRRRVVGVGAAGVVAVLVPLLLWPELSAAIHRGVLQRGAWGCAPFVIVPALALARRIQKRIEDRDVVETVTERERAYREPPLARVASRSPARRLRHLLASAPAVVLSLVYTVWHFDVLGDGVRQQVAAAVAILVVLAAGVGLQRLVVFLAARRRARREVQWERWLDSADSCEVGPRKWTK